MDRLWRLAYRLAHATLRLWWAVRRPRAEGAAIAAWWEGRLLVVETSYRPGLLDLPGGARGRREDARTAARRELGEETGLVVPEAELDEPITLTFPLEGRRVRMVVFTWRAPGPVAVRIDRREIVAAHWVTPVELAARRLAPGLALYLARHEAAADEGTSGPRRSAQGSIEGRAEPPSGGRTPPQTSPT